MNPRITKIVILALAVGLSAAAIATRAAKAEESAEAIGAAPQGEVPLLVSTDWVAVHKDDPDVLLVHVAMLEMSPPSSFIPGAVALDYHAIETSEDLPIELPPVDVLAERFSAIGVTNDKHIVLYGPAPAHIAARAFVTLEYLGHDRVSVMDGGIGAWVADGRPVTKQAAEAAPTEFRPHVNTDMVVDAEWIRERLEDPNIALIDARPPDQFVGPSNRGLRPGHIPGAGNIYFVELLESEEVHRLKPKDDAAKLFVAAGAAAGSTVVSYCQIGMRASYNYLIARHLGYDVKFYDASWVDWGRRTNLPAETGKQR